jgi:hypothetical protein
MKRLFWRLAPEVVLVSFLVSAGGCDPNHDVKAGPPELLGFTVNDNVTGGSLETTSDGGAVAVSAYVHVVSLFDRLLDTTAIGGFDGDVETGSALATVTVVPTLSPGVSAYYPSFYSPDGAPVELVPGTGVSGGLIFGPGPTISTTGAPTFPSASTITVVLDPAKVRSKKGEPFTGVGTFTFQTSRFAASISVPMGDADPDAGADAGAPPVKPAMQPVAIAFNNLPGDSIADHVSVTAGGTAFAAVTVSPDASNPTIIVVAPTGSWPASTTVTVTVDATAADALGGTTGSAVSGSFTTGSN